MKTAILAILLLSLATTDTGNAQCSDLELQQLLANGRDASWFGYAVSLSGNVALIGAMGDDDAGSFAGSAYVFRYNGTTWVQEQELFASDPQWYVLFGLSVAVSGDVALIGAATDLGDESGSVYVFRYNGSAWVEEQKLLASDGQPFDEFGASVSVSGDLAVIGAYGTDDLGNESGSAYVFRYNGSIWVQEQKLHASDGQADDRFGRNVSLSGQRVLVGAYLDDDGGTDSGSAYVF